MTKKDLEQYGTYTGKKHFGIAKDFEWKEYSYKGERYLVSQFNDEVKHIARIYCECCGRAFLPSKIKLQYGLNTCVYCASQ